MPSKSSAPKATPIPMPTFAPVERPPLDVELEGAAAAAVEDSAAAEGTPDVVDAELAVAVVADGLVEPLPDCW